MTGAIFLDRDGVINENRADHVKSIREFRVLSGALDAIVRLSQHYPVFVVTNQLGIEIDAIECIHRYLGDWVISRGGMITDFYYCTHAEDALCVCRKPRPGMLLQAALDYGIDLFQSVVIGDQPSDIQAGNTVAATTIFVRSGLGRKWLQSFCHWGVKPDLIVDDLSTAADRILSLRRDLAELACG